MKHILLNIALLLLASVARTSAQTAFYVSPQGNDGNTGTQEYPFGTVGRAQVAARNTLGNATIYMRAGEYRLDTPIVLTPRDGNGKKKLTICAYPGEHVTIKGSKLLHIPSWKPYKRGIMKAQAVLPAPADMLFVNGYLRHMARYPDYDSTAVMFNGTSADATSPKRVKSWKNPAGGFLHTMHARDWGDFHYRITGKDKQGKLQLEGGHQNNRKSGLHPDNRMVENIFEELDAPGEWFYDSSESTLYYYPLPGEDIHTAKLEVPVLKRLVEFRGSEGEPVRNITIKGLEFCHATRTFMEKYEPLLRSDWTVYRGGAILLEGTEHCNLKNLTLHNLGGNAVFFSNYNRHSALTGSHIHSIGASAVCFVGDPAAVRSPSFEYGESVALENIDRGYGPKTNNYPASCKAVNNLIHNIGLFEKQVTGVELSMCRDIKVSHNSIYNVPRSGINVSEGTWGGHIIEYNDVFNTVKETGDHGSFNSWGRDRFWHPDYNTMTNIAEKEPELIMADAITTTVIRNNRFRCDRGWDIDLDDGSTNYHIYNNLCLNGGIKLREGFYRTVENNIIINNTFHPHMWFKNSGDVFTRNIVMNPYQPINVQEWGSCTDHNIFTSPAALEKARENGTDAHSIAVHISFVNPAAGDYRIQPDCRDVFRTGFHNFSMDNFGVTSPRLRKIALQPEYPLPVVVSGQQQQEITLWHGWNVKNLNTPGERSATGMDSERGVYVVSHADSGNPLRDYIRANDVILALNGKTINTLEDLLATEKDISPEQRIKTVIFRNQQENTILIPGNLLRQ